MSHPFYSGRELTDIHGDSGALLWELHQAVAYGDKDRATACLDAGASINGQNPDFGTTALMLAAAGGYWELAKMLLDRGAQPSIEDHGGRTAEDWARLRHWDDLENLIRARLPFVTRKWHEALSVERAFWEYGPKTIKSLAAIPSGGLSHLVGKSWRGLEYREVFGVHLRFDLFRPISLHSEKRNLIVLVHGGGWDGGDRNDPSVSFMGNVLLENGFCVATVDYRTAWDWRFPDPLQDLKAAVRHFRSHSDEFGIHPDRIGVFGHSAGAHLAILLGLTSADDELEKDSGDRSIPSSVQAVCGISCPCDFEQLVQMGEDMRRAVKTSDPQERKGILESFLARSDLRPILETMNVFDFPLNLRNLAEPETAKLWLQKFEWSRSVRLPRGLVHAETLEQGSDDLLRASPLTYARRPRTNGTIPPFLLLHGARDPLIPASGCENFQRALKVHFAEVDVRIDPNTGHWHSEAFQLVPDFFARTLKNG